MQKEIYNKSVETHQLQLVGFGSNLSHFGLVGYLLIMPIILLFYHLLDFLRGNQTSFRDGELLFFIIPSILAIVVYLIQKKRLRFRVIQTKLNPIQLKEILISIAKELEWQFISSTKDAYVAQTNPSFFSGSWGEQITVLFYQNYVLVNSICDPKKRASVVSWGRNRKNEETLVNKITEQDSRSEIVTHLAEQSV